MKKGLIALLAVIITCFGILAYLIWRPSLEPVVLDKQADLYALTSEGIISFRLKDNQLHETAFHQTDLSDASRPSTHLIDQRYWVFHEMGYKQFLSTYIFSLDLEDAVLRREPSKVPFYDSLLVGEKGVYGFAEGGIHTYDKLGHELGFKTLQDKGLITLTALGAKDGQLYAVGHADLSEAYGEDRYVPSLYIFKEDDLTLVDTVLLTDRAVYYGQPNHPIILGDSLYYTLSDYWRDDDSDYQATDSLIQLNLKTKEKTMQTLGSYVPIAFYGNPDGHQLFVENDSYETGELLVKVFDIKTGQQDVLNLSEDLPDWAEDYPYLNTLYPLDDRRVLLVVDGYYDHEDTYHDGQIYLYDIKEHRVLSQLSLDKRHFLGFVKNPQP